MDCKQAKELMVDLLYDELSPESASELEDHLAECEECLKYREELQQTVECLDKVEDLRVPVDLAALHDVIERKRKRIRRFLNRQWPAWAAVVGVCGIMLSIFTLFASEIQYEDNALTIRFRGQKGESLAEKTTRILADYRAEQTRFQGTLSRELGDSIVSLTEMIDEYESRRDKQLEGTFQQMQVQQYQMLVAIHKELESLALRTEDEFERSYLTMAAMADLTESR